MTAQNGKEGEGRRRGGEEEGGEDRKVRGGRREEIQGPKKGLLGATL